MASPSAAAPSVGPVALPVADAYLVNLRVGRTDYAAILRELQPGALTASFIIALPIEDPQGEVMLTWQSPAGLSVPSIEVGRWSVRLDALSSNPQAPVSLLQLTVPPVSNVPDGGEASALAARGYSLAVSAQNDLLFGTVFVELALWPRPVTGLGPSPSVAPTEPSVPITRSELNAVIDLDGWVLAVPLAQTEPRRLDGAMRAVPRRPRITTIASLTLTKISTAVPPDAPLRLVTWKLRVDRLAAAADGQSVVLLDRTVPARRTGANFPIAFQRGFRILVTAVRSGPLTELAIYVESNR